jgi:hemolysin activation/secretion protein
MPSKQSRPQRPQFALMLMVLMTAFPVLQARAQSTEIEQAARQADQLRRQQQEQIARDKAAVSPASRPPEGADLKALAPKADASKAGQGCHEIRAVRILGGDQMMLSDQQRITDPFAQRCLGVSDIEQLLGAITKYYIDRGFITTRAYLPAQDLSTGQLDIQVIEGRIEKIILEDGDRRSLRPGTLLPREGALLNLRDIEQGIDQANKLASNNATLDIQPGQLPGGSVVVIKNEPGRPWHVNLSVDNQGSKSTGRTEMGATVSVDNLLSFNEFLMYTHRQSVPGDRTRQQSISDSISAALPLGYVTLTGSASSSGYVSTIHAPSGADLQTRGTSMTSALGIERLMFRDQNSRFTLGATLTRKAARNYLAGQFLGVSSRTLSVLDTEATYSWAGASSFLEVSLGYSNGLTGAGALRDPDNLPDTAPRAQFNKLRYGYQYIQPFSVGEHRFSFSSNLTGQSGNQVLYGSEQISIGGLYSVRGFVDNTLSGDKGFYVRNELSFNTSVKMAGQALPLRLFVGLDHGRVSNRVSGIPEGSLTGMALGASTNWRGLSAEISATRGLSKPSFMSFEPTQFWLRIGFSF